MGSMFVVDDRPYVARDLTVEEFKAHIWAGGFLVEVLPERVEGSFGDPTPRCPMGVWGRRRFGGDVARTAAHVHNRYKAGWWGLEMWGPHENMRPVADLAYGQVVTWEGREGMVFNKTTTPNGLVKLGIQTYLPVPTGGTTGGPFVTVVLNPEALIEYGFREDDDPNQGA